MSQFVRIVPLAILDIEEIYSFLLAKEGVELPAKILNGIQKAVLGLSRLPQRGHFIPELDGLGFTDFREVHFKPYRIIYQTRDKEAVVLVVADGRRDFQTLLSHRLVR